MRSAAPLVACLRRDSDLAVDRADQVLRTSSLFHTDTVGVAWVQIVSMRSIRHAPGRVHRGCCHLTCWLNAAPAATEGAALTSSGIQDRYWSKIDLSEDVVDVRCEVSARCAGVLLGEDDATVPLRACGVANDATKVRYAITCS